MIWRLTYCNKKGVEARVDIIRGNRTPVEIVQGSGQPFTLAYKLDKNDKSGHIMTSSADIEIFETETFNIDDLKTSNETELKVEYFENNILTWSGFILPDFFSREIGSPNIVRMTASDRLTALKGVTLSDLPAKVSLRDLIELSLDQTGLSLALVSQVQINQGSTNILDSEILSQRLTDVRGRSISCYDILMSIMVGTNSTIRQRKGQWQVYNKLEHELRAPTIFFDKVERGAIRTIQPVASSVGVYNEFGGNKMYPQNYDFSNGLTWWTTVNGFIAGINNKEVTGYTMSGGDFFPIYGNNVETNSVINKNASFSASSSPYLKSENVAISYPDNDSVDVTVEVNATGVGSYITNSFVEFAIIAINTVTSKTLSLSNAGIFETITNTPHIHRIKFPTVTSFYNASTGSLQVKGALIAGDENLGDYDIHLRIYGSGEGRTSFINSATIKFSVGGDNPKGNLYKTTQGSNFTKQHDIETVIFGDYIRGGINGHFYYYPIDDTSNLFLPSGTLSPPQWITAFDPTERPLLHHISRQKSTLFSVAHDILKANINVESFDPLAVFQDCKGGKYVVVSARFDFLRSEVNVELEQIAYDDTILKRDFIYSYFGEGEDTIKSIGGIAGGGGGTGGGGGMTSEQLEMLTNLADWWRLDAENDAIYSEKSVYSLKGVSALGLGSEGGGGGGGDIYMLDSWANYTAVKANYYVPASLLVPFRNDTLSRLASLEAGGGAVDIEIGGRNLLIGSTDEWEAVNAYSNQPYIDIPFNETKLEVGQTYVFSWETELLSGSPTIAAQVTLGAGVTSYLRDIIWTGRPIIGKQFRVFTPTETHLSLGNSFMLRWYTNNEVFSFRYRRLKLEKGNKATDWTPAPEDVDAKISLVQTNLNTHISNGTANAKHLTDVQLAYLNDLIGWWKVDASGNLYTEKNLYSTKGVSALGLGSGGGSGDGGADMLDSWANYTTAKADYYVPASLLVPFRNDTLSRLTSLESGSATSITTTGTGNAITSLTKSGSVITANKGLTFALASHTHTIAQITGLQGALDLKATQSDITTAIDGIEIGGRNLIAKKYIKDWNLVDSSIVLQGSDDDGDYLGVNQLTLYVAVGGGGAYNDIFQGKINYNEYTQYALKVRWKMAATQNAPGLLLQFKYSDGTYSGYITLNGSDTTLTEKSIISEVGKTVSGISCVYGEATSRSLIYDIQMTEGNKHTAGYSVAPEDQISDWNTTDVTSLSYIKNKPTTLAGYGITDGVTLNTAQTITGAKTFDSNITLAINRNIQGTDSYTGVWNVDNLLWRFGSSNVGSVANIRSEKVGIGTDNPLYKLDVSGTGRFTSSLIAPKVDFGNGFTIEPSGTELVFKYNGVIKQRMLSNGTILGTGGVTALVTN